MADEEGELVPTGDDLARNEQELLALTGAQDEDDLAWQLFSEIDGAVHLAGDAGVNVLIGWQTEGLSYPFTITDLRALAKRMESVEDELRSRE